jgi:hypothetical protein
MFALTSKASTFLRELRFGSVWVRRWENKSASPFHVRRDGWMGICLTHTAQRVIEPAKPLRLRYGLYVHSGKPAPDALDRT